ncbi:unnamed protein product [Prunus armeniaca]|uniref:Uncharacterized protein n=1 Tax=Prunus armeniaca TaxID=36596 RepID=A0A6J5XYU6_PRUAR|nr:unnamed protein product [Prunus armeniaca]
MVSWVQFDRIEGTKIDACEDIEDRITGSAEMKVSDLEEMNRQREDGVVSLKMEMFAWATYKKGWWGTEDVMMEAHCLDLRVGFLPKVGFGSWITGGPMTCSTSSYAS